MNLYDQVSENLVGGRIAIPRDEAKLFVETLRGLEGVHVEIGVLWGGTIALAALAKGTGQCIGIDPMDSGWWVTGKDPMVVDSNPLLSPGTVAYNLVNIGVAHMVNLVRAYSDPWPLPDNLKPTSAFIDGDHTGDWPMTDWLNLRDITRDVIMFHDVRDMYPDIQKAVDNIVLTDEDWYLAEQVQSLAVFRRVES